MKENELISAKVIEHTLSPTDAELVTIELTCPKFLDAEFEKHRQISSNSSSSRAIPFNRTLSADIFLPADIRKDERGMQGYKTFDDIDTLTIKAMLLEIYDFSKDRLRDITKMFNPHKQHLNRYLEPFTIQRKIATANIEWWDYFIMLRASTDADPAIQDLAIKIKNSIASAKPIKKVWHIPYVEGSEYKLDIKYQLIHSVARCARVSYNNFDGKRSSLEQDEKLFNFLTEAMHLTPFEHQAMSIAKPYLLDHMKDNTTFNQIFKDTPNGVTHIDEYGNFYSGNFRGFSQYRKMM